MISACSLVSLHWTSHPHMIFLLVLSCGALASGGAKRNFYQGGCVTRTNGLMLVGGGGEGDMRGEKMEKIIIIIMQKLPFT